LARTFNWICPCGVAITGTPSLTSTTVPVRTVTAGG